MVSLSVILCKPKIMSRLTLTCLILLSWLLASCTMFSSSNANLEATVNALSLQSTIIAQQSTQDAQNLQATMLSNQATQIAMMLQPTIPPPQPTITQPELPTPEATLSSPDVQVSDEELETKMKAARILLFEDVSGNRLGLLRYVKEAMDGAGYSYTDVGSAQGWFKDQLIADKEWDLIIVAAELSGMMDGQGRISGEYFDYLYDHLNRGTAVVMEIPTLNYIFQGNIRKILDQCGVEFQSDWTSPPSSSIWFLDREHPIFHTPNEIGPSLRDYQKLWVDSGDMLKIKKRLDQPVGDAVFLAGPKLDAKDSYGALTTCLQGRLILQTFATHHYNREDIVRLWQNYAYFALKNRFLSQSQ